MRDRFLGALGLGQDQAKPKEVSGGKTIEIGGSNYLLSEEAMGYIAGGGHSGYEKSKSVLILQEPHASIEGQINLYKFLEVLYRDHPDLVSKTVFLAEGYPAGKPLDLKPLVEVEPNPSDELIWEVLSTNLITGYMAYEWKYRRGIPIVGTEDESLYQISGRVWSSISDETSPFWKLSVVLRNKSMADVLVDMAKEYDNPILFVGGKHLLERLDENDTKGIDGASIDNVFGKDVPDFFVMQGQNKCIHDYLEAKRMGYNFFVFKGLTTERETARYRMLFEAQGKGDYQGFIKSLAVTTRPSPEAAADFVREFKKYPAQNPEARKANERGLSLASQGKYTEAAQEFSAASAANPDIPGYVISTQEALFSESNARILSVTKNPERPFKIKPGVKYDLPIFGPYIEKDHYQQISVFSKDFAKTQGVQDVINRAMSHYWEIRYGGIFQIKTAERIGQVHIRAFEERRVLRLRGLKGGRVEIKADIATKDNIAIECKNIAPKRVVTPGGVKDWLEQAMYRFEQDERGRVYDGVIIVVPDEKDIHSIRKIMDSYLGVYYPELKEKVKVCRLSEVSEEHVNIRKR